MDSTTTSLSTTIHTIQSLKCKTVISLQVHYLCFVVGWGEELVWKRKLADMAHLSFETEIRGEKSTDAPYILCAHPETWSDSPTGLTGRNLHWLEVDMYNDQAMACLWRSSKMNFFSPNSNTTELELSSSGGTGQMGR